VTTRRTIVSAAVGIARERPGTVAAVVIAWLVTSAATSAVTAYLGRTEPDCTVCEEARDVAVERAAFCEGKIEAAGSAAAQLLDTIERQRTDLDRCRGELAVCESR